MVVATCVVGGAVVDEVVLGAVVVVVPRRAVVVVADEVGGAATVVVVLVPASLLDALSLNVSSIAPSSSAGGGVNSTRSTSCRADVMKAFQILAGKVPPVTTVPCTSVIWCCCPSGYPIHTTAT